MNLQRVTITAKYNSETILAFDYFNRPTGTQLTLTIDGQIIESKAGDPPVERRKTQAFNRNVSRYTFLWDVDDPNHKGSLERSFLLQHPAIDCPTFKGNSNAVSPNFNMIDHYAEDIASYDHMSNLISAFNMVMSMSAKDLMDVLYYFGQDPKDMSKRKMILTLIEPQDAMISPNGKPILTGGGILQGITPDREAAKEFLEVFGDLTQESRRTINVRKAVATGIVTIEGTSYKFNGEVVGSSLNEVLTFFNINTDKYEKFLLPKVEQAINLAVADDLDSKHQTGEAANYAPLKPIQQQIPKDKFTKEDLENVQREIAVTENNKNTMDAKTYLSTITSLKMKRSRIQRYLEQAVIDDNMKTGQSFHLADQLKKQGVKETKKKEKVS